MATLVVFGDTADDSVLAAGALYSDARAGVGAGTGGDGGSMSIGQQLTAGVYWVWEGCIGFDTSAVTDVTLSAATLELFSQPGTDHSTTNFTIDAYVRDWGTTVTGGDFVAGANLGALTKVATLATSGYVTSAYNVFADVALAANVTHGAFTRLLLASDNQRLNVAPTGDEYVDPSTANASGTTTDPKITLTYTDNRKAFISGDRVKETTTTTGTGNITLAGAVSGFTAFSMIPSGIVSGDVVAYAIVGTTEWEVGIGAWHTGNTLSRDQVLASSNAGALVNFSAGTKDVFNTLPAAYGLLPLARQTQTTDVLVPSKGSTYVTDYYELLAGKELELGSSAAMEIG